MIRLCVLFCLLTGTAHANPPAAPESPSAPVAATAPAQFQIHGNSEPSPQSTTPTITEVTLTPVHDKTTEGSKPAPEVRSFKQIAAEEIRSTLRLGAKLTERREYESAETALLSILQNRDATRIDKRDALLALGHLFRVKGDLAKAVAVYEKYFKDFPADETAPGAYLDLGRTLRAIGSPQLAISRFYSVINSTLKLPANGFGNYRQLAKTAQFEIAETYFQSGDFAEASRYFSRLKLLDLAPVDRSRAHFKSVYSLYLAQDNVSAATGLRGFLEQNPDDENAPEARYLLAVTLRHLNRLNEAYEVTLDLLRSQRSRTSGDPKRWAYWQRRTGNQLANEYYEQADYQSALVIYQSLAEISPDPAWRLPVLYQIGLCEERLHQTDRARATYKSILDIMPEGQDNGSPRSQLHDIVQMVAWRLEHLNWRLNTAKKTEDFFKTFPKTPPVTTVTTPGHDANGSPPSPSTTL